MLPSAATTSGRTPGASGSTCGIPCTCGLGVLDGVIVPSTKSVWNRSWLAPTDSPRRISESFRPASRTHTMSDSSQGTSSPRGPGISPPPVT